MELLLLMQSRRKTMQLCNFMAITASATTRVCSLHVFSFPLISAKVYKYKVVSTIFNDDIYGIEIIYLQERLHVLVNILAVGSLV
jgi:hypothetical protein